MDYLPKLLDDLDGRSVVTISKGAKIKLVREGIEIQSRGSCVFLATFDHRLVLEPVKIGDSVMEFINQSLNRNTLLFDDNFNPEGCSLKKSSRAKSAIWLWDDGVSFSPGDFFDREGRLNRMLDLAFSKELFDHNIRKRALYSYALLYLDALPLNQPDGGDCYDCHFINQETGLPDRNIKTEHILDHMDKKEVVPSILANALSGVYLSGFRLTNLFLGLKYCERHLSAIQKSSIISDLVGYLEDQLDWKPKNNPIKFMKDQIETVLTNDLTNDDPPDDGGLENDDDPDRDGN